MPPINQIPSDRIGLIFCSQNYSNAIKRSIFKLECWKIEVNDYREAEKRRRSSGREVFCVLVCFIELTVSVVDRCDV